HQQEECLAQVRPERMSQVNGDRRVKQVYGIAPASAPLQPPPGFAEAIVGDLGAQPEVDQNPQGGLRPVVADPLVKSKSGNDKGREHDATAEEPLRFPPMSAEIRVLFGQEATEEPAR